MANGHGGKREGAGRKKGSLNKVTLSVKEAVLEAFDNLGGVEHMTKWAKENPTDFYRIAAKLIPQQISADVKHTYDAAELSDEELADIAAGGGQRASTQKGSQKKPDSVH